MHTYQSSPYTSTTTLRADLHVLSLLISYPSEKVFGPQGDNKTNLHWMALLRQLHSIMNHKKHGKFTSDEPIWTETMEYSWANREHHDLPWLALTDDAESKPHNPVLTRWLYTYPAIKWVLEHWEALLLYSGFQKDACGNADWQKAAWSQVHKMLLASDMRLTLTFLYNFYDNFLAEEFHYAMGKPRNALFQTDRVLQRERVLRAAA